ncbi:MAG: hypothetical protein R3F59_30025 [Myxococcota bacterium]
MLAWILACAHDPSGSPAPRSPDEVSVDTSSPAAPPCEPGPEPALACLPTVNARPEAATCPPLADTALTPTSARAVPILTDAGYLVCDRVPPGTRVRIETAAETLEGEWVASHVEDYWYDGGAFSGPIDDPRRVTQVLFDPALADDDPRRDRALRFVSSDDIASMRVVPAPDPPPPAYLAWLRARGLCLHAGLLGDDGDPVLFVDRGNLDPRDHLREIGLGLFAWDLVQTAPDGCGVPRAFSSTGADDADHYVWDRPLVLPVGGRLGPDGDEAIVLSARGSHPDIAPQCTVTDADPGEENEVVVALAGRFQLAVVHLREGSLPNAVGDRIREGALLGRIGNSGLTQFPHVHVTLLWDDSGRESGRPWSVPVEFCDGEAAGDAGGASAPFDHGVPAVHTWLSPTPFTVDAW